MENRNTIITQLQAFKTGSRKITGIVIHCSANRPGSSMDARGIDRVHKARGWKGIGYHFVILEDGTIERGRPLEQIGAHVSGHNSNTIGICYIGGLDESGEPADTRTDEQKDALLWLLTSLRKYLPGGGKLTIKGHRDYSPDLNKNGIIEYFEFIKACPCFDVSEEYADICQIS